MDAARLRKAFKYPSDDDDNSVDGTHDEMDEQEQEALLTNLRASESATNAQYTLIFTALPGVVALPFVWYLVLATSTSMALLCLLSITSLASSAYTMYFIPVVRSSSQPPLSSRAAPSMSRTPHNARPSTLFATAIHNNSNYDDASPVTRCLPYLNGAIGLLLALAALAYRPRSDVPEGLWLFLLLPGVVMVMVAMARSSIGEIQAGLSELQGMRYDYKGA